MDSLMAFRHCRRQLLGRSEGANPFSAFFLAQSSSNLENAKDLSHGAQLVNLFSGQLGLHFLSFDDSERSDQLFWTRFANVQHSFHRYHDDVVQLELKFFDSFEKVLDQLETNERINQFREPSCQPCKSTSTLISLMLFERSLAGPSSSRISLRHVSMSVRHL